MLVDTPISVGELIDKISILYIKKKNIFDKKKIILVNEELKFLEIKLKNIPDKKNNIEYYLNKLIDVNFKLWKIEDDIREYERMKKFDKKFVELARLVYFTNDERSKIKLEINNKFNSQIIEVKSYKDY